MKFLEAILTSLLEFLGLETAKFALGDLFAVLVVSGFAWIVLSVVFVLPLRLFEREGHPARPMVEASEKVAVALAFLVAFGGCFYLWSIGF